MASKQVTVTTTGASSPIKVDLRKFKFGVGLVVTFGTGAAGTVNVEVSGDPTDAGSGSAIAVLSNWNLHDTLQALTASRNSSLAFPVTAIRLNPSSLSGGSVTLSVVQAEG